MLTESRIREVLAELPDLLLAARAAGDDFLPVPHRPDPAHGEQLLDVIAGPLAERMPDGERSVGLIHDLHRIVELHGFLSGVGSIAAVRERLTDPAWEAAVAERVPAQAATLAARARRLSDHLAQVPPAEEAAVRACGQEITATMARLTE